MLALSLVYFGNVACVYGVGFWLPTIVKGFGLSIAMTGWVNAIPYVVGFLGMVWWGMRSDRMGERTMHLAIALALAAIGIGGSAFLTDPTTKMIALTVGSFGVFASLPIFWTLPTAFLAGAAVAPGHRGDQLDRQSLGLFRPLRHGLDQGRDRQLRLGTCRRSRPAPSSRSSSRWRSATTRISNARPRRRNERRSIHADATRFRRLRPVRGRRLSWRPGSRRRRPA